MFDTVYSDADVTFDEKGTPIIKEKKTRIFVYGTLKRGRSNNRLLQGEGVTFIGEAITKNKYIMHGRGIPYVSKLKEPKCQIHGEVFEITNTRLRRVDMLEGYNPSSPEGSWYYREEIPVILKESGDEITAEIYFNETAPSNAHVVEDGNF